VRARHATTLVVVVVVGRALKSCASGEEFIHPRE
jgi:hypothetical protein